MRKETHSFFFVLNNCLQNVFLEAEPYGYDYHLPTAPSCEYFPGLATNTMTRYFRQKESHRACFPPFSDLCTTSLQSFSSST